MEVTDKGIWNLANKWKLQKRLAGTRQTNGSYRRAYLKPGKQWKLHKRIAGTRQTNGSY